MTPEQAKERGIRFKALDWVKHPNADIWRCNTQAGVYKVFGIGETPTWDFDSHSDRNDRSSRSAKNVEAAKAAAQADYEARILEALE